MCGANEQHLYYPKGCYQPSDTIFDLLEDRVGIYVDPTERYFPYRITYDIESYMLKDLLPNTDRVKFTAKHKLMSISVCSNVPGLTSPRCFVISGSEIELIRAFVDCISNVSRASCEMLLEQYSHVVDQ